MLAALQPASLRCKLMMSKPPTDRDELRVMPLDEEEPRFNGLKRECAIHEIDLADP